MYNWKEEEIVGLREASKRAATILSEMVNHIKIGMNTLTLDAFAGELMKKLEVNSAPQQDGFPGNTCISVWPIIAHGVPGKRIMRCGDLINIDVSVEYKGFYGDVGYSFVLGGGNEAYNKICETGKASLKSGIEKCRVGNKLNDLGRAMEDVVRPKGYTIIKNLCSHGIGRQLHVSPCAIYNFYNDEQEDIIQPGMIMALEPYVSSGACRAKETENEWNLTTHNKSIVVQYEHTILVTEDGPEVLTVID